MTNRSPDKSTFNRHKIDLFSYNRAKKISQAKVEDATAVAQKTPPAEEMRQVNRGNNSR